ncbi:serine/threonine-protein kinase [Saccharothrix lopnurensis]|uniref:non-specific serine/threonine protein kinase n=1 Tax=Saccharothrix lopnurensis TaxID=1670621 RepID=A0ABW1P157_9PSEU
MWDGDLTGEVVDERYELADLYGSGGMAEVYRASDRRLDRGVAIKFFQGEATSEDRIRLVREAEVLGALRCPGLIEVYDTGVHRGRPYFVMQPIEGGTLRRRMREALAPAVVAHLGAQVAEVLAHVHANGVVHRDVKPSNILLDTGGRRAYLADFGLALQAQVTRVTRTGVLVGTAGYLAPEQVRGADVGPATDVYALGLVLLECLTGRPEYPGGDTEAALARLHREPRVPVNLPRAFTAALTAMTATDPDHRPTAAECARLLTTAERLCAGLPPLARVAVATPSPAAPARRRGNGVLLGGAVAAAAALTLLVVLNLGDAPPGENRTGQPEQPAGTTTAVQPVVRVPATTDDPRPEDDRSPVTVVREAPVQAPPTTTTADVTTTGAPAATGTGSAVDHRAVAPTTAGPAIPHLPNQAKTPANPQSKSKERGPGNG